MENDEQLGESSNKGQSRQEWGAVKGISIYLTIGFIFSLGPPLFSTLDPLWQKQAIRFQTWSLWNVENPLHAHNKDIVRLKGKCNLTHPSRNDNQIILPLNMISLGLGASGEEKVSCKYKHKETCNRKVLNQCMNYDFYPPSLPQGAW